MSSVRLFLFIVATSAWHVLAQPASTAALLDATYDFVIIGAGTCGLVIANRLSELHNVSVAVIEAGASVYDNVLVSNPDNFGGALNTEIDWAYPTVNQTYADGRSHVLNAGKAIGGTSTINGKRLFHVYNARSVTKLFSKIYFLCSLDEVFH